jgi:hypothetical protein
MSEDYNTEISMPGVKKWCYVNKTRQVIWDFRNQWPNTYVGTVTCASTAGLVPFVADLRTGTRSSGGTGGFPHLKGVGASISPCSLVQN